MEIERRNFTEEQKRTEPKENKHNENLVKPNIFPSEAKWSTSAFKSDKLTLNFDQSGKIKLQSSSKNHINDLVDNQQHTISERRPKAMGVDCSGKFEITPKLKPGSTAPLVYSDDIEDIERYSDLNQNSQVSENSIQDSAKLDIRQKLKFEETSKKY